MEVPIVAAFGGRMWNGMMTREIVLAPNTQVNRPIGSFSVIHVHAPREQAATVRLSVESAGEEARHSLTVGDVFSVQDQRWKFDRIVDLYSPTGDWTVVLARVE
ncbi:DUF6406 domain-containing protein [Streptomyces caniscabiei]|uniref:Uncharacterized protein n=1 Tax=Streptomyces caniscabiei TaxID=2746961 RepID=A0A927QML0_9ACTN|nr:DUF6406 domain-containing protein [Streptomyces caniscabiei]MBD9725939.1 hypothetical protein [Streptomyces caniscabiei]MDX3507660.1 hypothetical protein [Streptomyces caniscabiei]MDX3717622.1 hypothetical protein [Streptomyces caniscabiei]WEO25372.1 hypothetical protein IHE65_20495 [Streptomyces caniscabiei]